jgi:arginine exporter protein ArgO
MTGVYRSQQMTSQDGAASLVLFYSPQGEGGTQLMTAFWEGLIAGYGIAIPVGAIAILIMDTALRGGFRPGFFAGAGAASADLIYATLAAVAGTALAEALRPYSFTLQIASALVLIGLGGWGLWGVRKLAAKAADPHAEVMGSAKTYGKFLGLTLLNPATVAYFAALIFGGSIGALSTVEGRLLFVLGAAIASLSWQSLIALLGAMGNKFFSPKVRVITNVIGNVVVIGLGVRILVMALWT